jgi:phage gpG-like protein
MRHGQRPVQQTGHISHIRSSAGCITNTSESEFVVHTTDEFRLLKYCGRDGSSAGRGGYLKKSLDRNTTGPLASTGPSKNLRDARSSIASRSRTN